MNIALYNYLLRITARQKQTLHCSSNESMQCSNIELLRSIGADHVINLTFLNDLLENGEINPIIDKKYPLDRIAEAHEYVAKKHKKGNVVIDMAVVST
ncbi:MAG: zinc-binding dehydrogenase [Candidatus Kapabacteria bacterium]|jgi:hypothetical protein|nr:zinc-binding dehydrogenase [Candidatus Kapabacteria bacterium]